MPKHCEIHRGCLVPCMFCRVATLEVTLERVRQGFRNILVFRKIAESDRYGALTRAEIEEEIAVLDRALSRDDNREMSKR